MMMLSECSKIYIFLSYNQHLILIMNNLKLFVTCQHNTLFHKLLKWKPTENQLLINLFCYLNESIWSKLNITHVFVFCFTECFFLELVNLKTYYCHKNGVIQWSLSTTVWQVQFHVSPEKKSMLFDGRLLFKRVKSHCSQVVARRLWCEISGPRHRGERSPLTHWLAASFSSPCRSDWSSLSFSQVSVKEIPPGCQTQCSPPCIKASTFKSPFSTERVRERYTKVIEVM